MLNVGGREKGVTRIHINWREAIGGATVLALCGSAAQTKGETMSPT